MMALFRLWGYLAVFLIAMTLLFGCGSTQHKPVGTGSQFDELIESPCACDPLPRLNQWLV